MGCELSVTRALGHHTLDPLPPSQVTDGHLMGCELSVTRSLGHRTLEAHGVISEPHITRRELEVGQIRGGC